MTDWREHEQSLFGGDLFIETDRFAPMKPYVPPPPKPEYTDERPEEVGLGGDTLAPERICSPEPATEGQMALLNAPPSSVGAPDMRTALRQLREYRGSLPKSVRDAADVILARLEPEYEELIRIYVHFEHAADIANLGKVLGIPLASSVRQVRYSRNHVEASAVDVDEQQRSGREKTFDELQTGLFETEEWWESLWEGMPEFDQRDLSPVYSIEMLFISWEDVDHFEGVVGQTVPRGPKRTPSIWFPEAEIGRIAGRAYRSDDDLAPRYPLFVISKGRADTRMTARSLERAGVPYRIVVEPQELAQYAAVIDQKKILVTPFSNLGQGSIPVRNFVWQTAVDEGFGRHWVIDDNIDGLWRLHNNLKLRVETSATLRAIEDWSDRYENIGLSGPNYFMFASRKTAMPPLTLNTRVYSCILVNHSLDGVLTERWRGRYNEDTDLSLRALKTGWCTALFNAFLILKQTTMTMKGGNTDELYKDDGRRAMADSLVAQHPDVTTVTWKWGRWQHSVNYEPFKRNKLVPKDGVVISAGANNYGMELVEETGEPR